MNFLAQNAETGTILSYFEARADSCRNVFFSACIYPALGSIFWIFCALFVIEDKEEEVGENINQDEK